MKTKSPYHGYRFPPAIIAHAVWLYHRFSLSFRDDQDRYASNRAEASHQPTRAQERQMRGFKSAGQAQRFLSVHSQVRNLFCFGRHLLKARHYRELRASAFKTWQQVTCV